ncbi:hypothetical protein I6F35_33635 [Bradyrhizobium sp. BRP22]|uniref:hypothetical protein n=1 Tax=Bradyrhizobium sp. BRP22 TaxID=2793821 RepID=UPI001CD78FC0|nr:hypothetical protein [Bradyrhizobium sp. BRP22]MCA1458078.1 hypothetical protein [Bradyrhizobium sp. BRP22]
MAVLAFPVGGALIRAWTPDKIKSEIEAANTGIRAALRAGDMDLALTLISRKVGLRACAGEIKVSLRPPTPQALGDNYARPQRRAGKSAADPG